MATEVPLPDHLIRDVQERVERGEFPDLPTAITELVRIGLEYKKKTEDKKGPPGGAPPLPESERPTSVDPSDVNWM